MNKPVVHLCIPQFFQPLPLWKNDFQFEIEAPELSLLLRQYQIVEKKLINGLDFSLFNMLGLEENQELPVAHYRSQIHQIQYSDKMMLCADPIHLEVGMNDITLTDQIIDLTRDEAEEILTALNKHFQQDGLEFIYGSNKHWYVYLPKEKELKTTPLSEVLRKNIAKYQPQYPEGKNKEKETLNWQVIQNESQMILHGCTVNQQREIAGLPTVNSLWFWGGGQALKSREGSELINIYYNENSEINAQIIANVANCDLALFNDIPTSFKEGKTLLIFDQLFSPAINDHLDLFQQEISKLDEIVIKPLRQAWQSGEIDILIDGCDGKLIKPNKLKAWQFWKKKTTLLSMVNAK